MRAFLAAALCGLLAVSPVWALDFEGTCRGPSATITEIGGLDTTRAHAVAQSTVPDAISYCHYTLGREAGKKNPGPTALSSCVEKFMREVQPDRAEANCRTGTLSRGFRGLTYKMPLEPTCGGDNIQAISIFKVLCPSYEGQTELMPD